MDCLAFPLTLSRMITTATAARRMALDELATAAELTEKPTRWTYFYVTTEATIGYLTSMTARLDAQDRPDFAAPIGYASEIAARPATVRHLAAAEQARRDEAEVDCYQ